MPLAVPGSQVRPRQVLRDGQVTMLLTWISSQRQFPRGMFGSRDGSLMVAGVGAAHVHRAGTWKVSAT